MKIGTNVDSWCSRCKLMLTHTIETAVDGKIKRVHCNTCRAQHAYRAKPPAARGTADRRKGAATGRKEDQKTRPSEYQMLLRGRTAAVARSYANSTQLKVGELVSHEVLGLGAVTGERENKIDVLFPDGPRVLLQRR